jgi:dTDP-4-dehydrorhamnose reductase
MATPILATDAAELIWRAIDREATGILHCGGGEGIDRVSLARRAVDAFGLDPELLGVGPPPEAIAASPAEAVPVDTRLGGAATAAALATHLPTVDELLQGMKAELFDMTEAIGCPS